MYIIKTNYANAFSSKKRKNKVDPENRQRLCSSGRIVKNFKFLRRGKCTVESQRLHSSSLNFDGNDIPAAKEKSSILMKHDEVDLSFDNLVSIFKTKDRFNSVLEKGDYGLNICNKNANGEDNRRINTLNLMKNSSRKNDTETNNKQILEIDNEDTFSKHFKYDLSTEQIENLVSEPRNIVRSVLIWPTLGRLVVDIPKFNKQYKNIKKKLHIKEPTYASEGFEPSCKKVEINNSGINSKLTPSITIKNTNRKPENATNFTDLQNELFCIINNYQDLFYPQQTFENSEEIRVTYCLHVLNHILKSRYNIQVNNHNLANESSTKYQNLEDNEYRDHGLVNPKILILLPFRSSVLKVINTMENLLNWKNSENFKENGYITNNKRFVDEFAGNTIRFPKTNRKPVDYEQIFTGNTNDNFKLGISLSNKSLKLYTDFYSSDMIIASPLGLRTLIGAPGDDVRDFDFLNSIEVLVLDTAEIFLAQNWDHILHISDYLHLKTNTLRATDYTRVRSWCLNGLSRFYRQTLLFASHEILELQSFFDSKCFNYRGKVNICNPILNGSIQNIFVEVPQVFYKIEASSFQSSFDCRFNYFIQQILPKLRRLSVSHCMIYIPSYFDFVRLRNYFKREEIKFVQICEYTKAEKIARARDIFFHSGSPFLLYSERSHFFRRAHIKGIRHLIFYQPPAWPHFYSEIFNLMQDSNQNENDGCENFMTSTVLYTKYDILQISNMLGSDRAAKLVKSKHASHAFSAK